MSDTAKRLEKADKYLQKGKPESALEEYLEILQEEPRNDAVRLKAADLSATLNRAPDAAHLFGELFDHEASVGDVPRATITYKKLMRVGKPSLDQTFQYAQFIEKSAKKEAADCFETAAAGFEQAGRKKDALTAFKHLVALDPSLAHLQREGELAELLGEAVLAAEAFVHAGELQKQAGGESLTLFERAHKLDAANNAASLACGEGYIAAGRAQEALTVLAPVATGLDSTPESREAYARALLQAGMPLEAEPYIRELFAKDAKRVDDIALLITAMLEADQAHKAVALAQYAEDLEVKRGRRREFVTLVKEAADKSVPRIEFLEYLVITFNSANREQDYCATLIKLFDLYFAAGNYIKAGDALDRAAEVDPYEQGHQKRLERLRGKIDSNQFNSIANRFGSVVQAGAPQEQAKDAKPDSEPTVLEDLMLQAEIFLQYSMRSKAVERLERISKLFPHEEEKTEKLRTLYNNAGFMPQYEPGDVAPPPKPVSGRYPVATAAVAAPPPQPAAVPQAMADEAAVDNFARVTEITRNIYRQASVKGVLFAAVNDVGRHWNATRCLAGLCTPGKPPSATSEYCAPGAPPGEIMAQVKLIVTLLQVATQRGTVLLENANAAAELLPIQEYVAKLGIVSLVAVPLMDGENHAGILVLAHDAERHWRQTDVVVLKTIADQMAQAVNNARLRSLMKTLAVTDEQSGLLKRSSYLDVMLSETRNALQQNSPMCLMLLQFGNAAMLRDLPEAAIENMMQQAGQTVCAHVRQNDVAVRYDRNTIAVLLGDTNDKNAFFVVDKLRKLMASTQVPGRDEGLSITAGIAEAVLQAKFEPVDIVTELINRGEAALEQARAGGGNKAQSLAASFVDAAVA